MLSLTLLTARAEVIPPLLAAPAVEPRTVGCSLDELEAAIAGGGHIRIACAEPFTLRAPLRVNLETHLEGVVDGVTLDGGGRHQIFQLRTGIPFRLTRLTLTRGAMSGPIPGDPSDAQGQGGVMRLINGSLLATQCRFTDNRAIGGVNARSVPGSQFIDYSGELALGGAIAAVQSQVELVDCRFEGNRAIGIDSTAVADAIMPFPCGDGRGGAVSALGGSLRIVRTVFENNHAQGGASSRIAAGPAGNAIGGAVNLGIMDGPCSIEASTFVGNSATGGNAARNNAAGLAMSGALHLGGTINEVQLGIRDCEFIENQCHAGSGWTGAARASGGAITSSGSIAVQGSLFVSNRVDGSTGIGETTPGIGGAVASFSRGFFEACTFRANTASGVPGAGSQGRGTPSSDGRGGALYASGTNFLSRCAFDGNQALGGPGLDIVPYLGAAGHGKGGAILIDGTLHATNCTFTANLAWGGSGPLAPGNGRGGAVAIDLGEFHGAFLSFSENQVRAGNGLVWTGDHLEPIQGTATAATLDRGPDAKVRLDYSILAESVGAPHCDPFRPNATTGVGNLVTDTSCAFAPTVARRIPDARLARVEFDLGPSPALALLSDSPALDMVAAADCPHSDQRSQARPPGAPCDIGAFELAAGAWVEGRVLTPPGTDPSALRVGTQPSAATAVPSHAGRFTLPLPTEGTRRVVPTGGSRFRPASREIQPAGPVGGALVFRAYPDDMLVVERDAGSAENHAVYAGPAGVAVRIETSPDLRVWKSAGEPVRTDAEGLAISPLKDPLSPDAGYRFLRVRRD